jgi:O-antigen/teichoic acid export membrane protein
MAFFRQSGWLVVANTLTGVFMTAVHPFASRMPAGDYGVFATLLRLFMILSVAATGLQIVVARLAAAALDDEGKRRLAATARVILRATFCFWLGLVLLAAWFQPFIVAKLKLTHPMAVWVTLAMVLANLWLPVFIGLLQGFQNFLWLGGAQMVNGFIRCALVAAGVGLFHLRSTWAVTAALLGFVAALLAAWLPCRHLLRRPPGGVAGLPWMRSMLWLTGGMGSALVLMNADLVVVQYFFPEQLSPYYAAAATIGVALVMFTTPMAAVMFPKLVRGLAERRSSNAFWLALGGTLAMGACGAVVCTLVPELPLRILFAGKVQFLASAILVPWFMWAMLPVTLANVLIGSLMARGRFECVPWLMAVAAGYVVAIVMVCQRAAAMDHFAAFKLVVQTLGVSSLLLLGVSAWFTSRVRAGTETDEGAPA